MVSCTEESEETGCPSGEQEVILHGVHTHLCPSGDAGRSMRGGDVQVTDDKVSMNWN